jgi:hypothetical protein
MGRKMLEEHLQYLWLDNKNEQSTRSGQFQQMFTFVFVKGDNDPYSLPENSTCICECLLAWLDQLEIPIQIVTIRLAQREAPFTFPHNIMCGEHISCLFFFQCFLHLNDIWILFFIVVVHSPGDGYWIKPHCVKLRFTESLADVLVVYFVVIACGFVIGFWYSYLFITYVFFFLIIIHDPIPFLNCWLANGYVCKLLGQNLVRVINADRSLLSVTDRSLLSIAEQSIIDICIIVVVVVVVSTAIIIIIVENSEINDGRWWEKPGPCGG